MLHLALRSYRNVFILATSNLIQGIDAAFLDRADVRLYIGLPNPQARYEILRSSLEVNYAVPYLSLFSPC